MTEHSTELGRALRHQGLPSGNVGMLLQAAAQVLAAWERAESWEAWNGWSRSEALSETMEQLEAALETSAPEEGDNSGLAVFLACGIPPRCYSAGSDCLYGVEK